MMAERFLTIGSLLMLGMGLFSGVAGAQTPAAINYGSLVPPTGSPILVAQTSLPAPITPAPVTPAAPPVAAPALMLPPLDPYSSPAQTSWFNSLMPVGNTGTSGLGQSPPNNIYSGNFDRFFPETYEAMRRFRTATSFQYTHLPRGSKENGFGMDEIDIRMQLGIPCRFIPDNGRTGFLYIAPGGSLAWWNGPAGWGTPAEHMSPNGFGAFLDVGVQPRFNESFGLIAWGRVGVFSDFENVTSDALRYQGRLEGVFHSSSQMQVHAGVIYYGRSRVKILPTLGVVWTPDEDWVLKLVFPNPKVSYRLWKGPQGDLWSYVHMEYAGGSWDIKGLGQTDYNDVRLGVGVEFGTLSRVGGYFEFGGSFSRELYYGGHSMSLPSAMYLKTGFIF